MRTTRSATLPAGVEDAFAVVATQQYQQEKVSAQAQRSSATVTEQDGRLVAVHTERTISTQGMPPAVMSLAGETLTITEQQTWQPPLADGSRRAALELTVGGVPLRMMGTISLSPTDGGSVFAVVADLSCAIPLLGRMIEQAAAPTIQGSIDLEARMLRERLA